MFLLDPGEALSYSFAPPEEREDCMGTELYRATRSLRGEDIEPKWHVVDANNQILGRLATQVAVLLRGKHRPIFTPHADAGDYVVVVNAEKIRLTGRKMQQKMYYRHSGWVGGLKSINAEKVLSGPHPERVVEHAVRGMLPKNALGRKLLKKLHVYAGPKHPHEAQKPEEFELG